MREKTPMYYRPGRPCEPAVYLEDDHARFLRELVQQQWREEAARTPGETRRPGRAKLWGIWPHRS
jgi:hypothetical protein